MERKFKVGDRVYIAKLPDGRYGDVIKIGAYGIVKAIYPSSVAVLLDGYRNHGSKHGYFYFPFDYLEVCNDKNNSKKVLIGDITNGYSFVDPEKAEELRIIKEKEEEKVRLFKNIISSTLSETLYGVPNVPLRRPQIEKVIFNNPATIVMWTDGTKTIVKCENEAFDEEKGLAMAISKKILGNKGNYYNEFKRWLPEKEEVCVSLDEAIENATENFKKLSNKFKSLKGDE